MTAYVLNDTVSVDNLPLISGALAITGTVTVSGAALSASVVFPSTLNVSGTVGSVIQNWPATIGVSASIPLQIWSAGVIGVSGNFASTTVTQTAQNVSSSSGLRVWNDSPVGISGSVALRTWDGGTQGISGTVTLGGQVSVNNFPAIQAVSGGVVIQNWPAVHGISASVPLQIWSAGAIGVSGTVSVTATTTQTAQNVSSSSGLRIFNDGPVGVSGTIGVNNFPATQNVSGGIVVQNWPAVHGVSASFPLSVWNAGAVGVSGTVGVNNFPAIQAISGGVVIQNWPAVHGISASVALRTWDGGVQGVSASFPLNVFNAGTVGISGTVGVNNFPAVQAVSGTVTVQGAPSGVPVQIWSAGTIGISGSISTTPGITQTAQNVSSSSGLRVFNDGLVGVSGTIGVNNFPATQNVSGTVTVNGSANGVPLQIWSAGTIGISGVISAVPGVTQTAMNVSSSSGLRVWNDGPVGISGTISAVPGITETAMNVSSSSGLKVWNFGSVGVSGTVGVNNFPATQNVSGSVTVGSWGTNVTASVQGSATGIPIQIWSAGTIGVSGTLSSISGITQTAQNVSSSSGLRVFNDGPVGVSGTVNLGAQVSINNFPAVQAVSGTITAIPGVTQTAQNVSSSSGLRVWNDGLVGVSGSVALNSQISVNNFPAIQAVSGGIVIQNWPATIGISSSLPLRTWDSGVDAVSGSQITGSTFHGAPVVAGGVWFASSSGPAYVKSLQTDVSGVLYVSASNPVNVWNAGTVGVSGSVALSAQVSVNNFPATQNVSGTVNVGTAPQFSINNFPAVQAVSGTITAIPGVTQTAQNVSSSSGLRVWNESSVGVSGTVSLGTVPQLQISNFPAIQAVSGGVVVQNWPAVHGISASFPLQVWSAGTIGVSGSVTTTPTTTQTAQNVSSSSGLRVWNESSVGVSGTVNIGTAPQFMISNFPAVQAVSGTITTTPTVTQTAVNVSSSSGLRVWNEGLVGVSGSVAISSAPQLSINNFPATQSVSGSVTIGSWGTNVTASIQGSALGIPLQIWSAGTIGVSGTLSSISGITQTAQNVSSSSGVRVWNESAVGVSGTVGVNNFPAVQAISGGIVVQNWPATIGVSASIPLRVWDPGVEAVSGSQLTGSTFAGSPVVVGGVWFASSSGPAYVKSLQTDVSGVLYVSSSTPINVWNSSAVGVTGSVTLGAQASVNNFPAVQAVSGGIVVQNWPAVIGVSSSFPLNVINAGTVGVSGTVTLGSQISVNNFPATQNVSGSITVGAWGTNVTASIQGSSQGIPLQIWSAGTIGVSGTLSSTPTTTQTAQNVSSSSGLRVWNDSAVGVSGTVSIGSQISVNNFPATQNVSGTIVVGSFAANVTASVQGVQGGIPQQIWTAGTIGISGTVTTSPTVTQTAQNVSSSSGLRVWNDSSVGVTGSVGLTSQVSVNNFPATQAVSGGIVVQNWPATLGVSSSFPLRVWDGGVRGVSASFPLSVFNAGTVGVSGTVTIGSQVGVSNFPATQNVSGSITIGTWGTGVTSSVQGVPGGIAQQVWSAGIVGVSGTVTTTPSVTQTAQNVSSSSGLRVWNDSSVGVSGTVGVNNFPATQAISGGIVVQNWPAVHGVSASFPLSVWNAGTVGVSGTVTLGGQIGVNNFPATQNVSGTVNIGTAPQFMISNFPAVQAVSGSVTTTPAVTQTAQNVSSSSGLRVWNEGLVGVSGSVTLGAQVSVNNFPATQNVSGTVNIGTAPQFSINNFPAVQAISGTVTSVPGVTQTAQNVSSSSGLRVWNDAAVGVSASVALRIWDGGVQGVTASSTLPVYLQGTVGVSGTVGVNNFPLTQNVSGTVNIGTAPQFMISNFPAIQAISGTVTATAGITQTAMNVSSSSGVRVWNDSPVGISGSVALRIWDGGIRGVSGTVTLGSQIGVSNFPATQAVSGGIVVQNWPAVHGISSSFPLEVWSEGTIGVSGTMTSTGSLATVVALRAVSASFTATSTQNASVPAVADVFGRQLVAHIDHSQFVSKAFNATTTQTGTDVWSPASGRRIAVTSVVVGSYGTTAGRLILWFGDNGDTTYTAGTDQVLLAASFAPSTTAKPGLVFTPATPVFCTAINRELHCTTDAAMSIDIVVHGYEY